MIGAREDSPPHEHAMSNRGKATGVGFFERAKKPEGMIARRVLFNLRRRAPILTSSVVGWRNGGRATHRACACRTERFSSHGFPSAVSRTVRWTCGCEGRPWFHDLALSPSRPRGRPSSPRWTLPPRPIPFGIPSVGFEAPNPPDGIPVCSSNRPVRRGSEKGNASVGFERRHFAHVEHDDAELQGARCFAKEARKEDGFVREVMPEGGGGGRAC